MRNRTTRRGFLRTAAIGSGCLMMNGQGSAFQARSGVSTRPGGAGGSPHGTAANGPIVVVTQSASTDFNPRSRSWFYLAEVLQRAGLFFEQLTPDQLTALKGRPATIALLAGDLQLTTEQRQLLDAMVKGGGSLIGIGGTSGLDEVFGVSRIAPVAEGRMKVTARDHPVTAGLRSSLHVFGGYSVKTGSATALAELGVGSQAEPGSAIVENRYGKGHAILLAPDLIFSVVHIQQGIPVLQDGRPAPDGSAELNEGVLKAEDGMVLDWQRDRSPMVPDGGYAFLEPVSDELREIILRSVFHAARQQGLSLPVLWYWPRGLKAVAHLSNDTDNNEPPNAVAMLEVLNRSRLKSTWCVLYPGGYPKDFYRKLRDQGFEIGLHYDAMTGGRMTSWSKENFIFQHQWLLKEAGIERIATNKNHYTRWEGRLDFFRWCEELGINSDQTRGPSKKGTIGFPLGGSQPYFPLDDERDTPRFLPVLEVNMLTQDLVVVCPAEYGRQLVDSVASHNGVAHFLFHPGHILKPMVSETLSGLVDYCRTQGLEWWTSEQIFQWETQRREVRAVFDSAGRFSLSTPRPLRGATLLMLKAGPRPRGFSINGSPVSAKAWTWHGFEFEVMPFDLTGEARIQIA